MESYRMPAGTMMPLWLTALCWTRFGGPAIVEFAFHIFRRRWALLCASEDGCGFVLPEDPLTMLSEHGDDRYGPGGIGDADEVWVPINRHHLLVMHRRSDEVDGICAKASPDFVSAYNRFQVGQPRQTGSSRMRVE